MAHFSRCLGRIAGDSSRLPPRVGQPIDIGGRGKVG